MRTPLNPPATGGRKGKAFIHGEDLEKLLFTGRKGKTFIHGEDLEKLLFLRYPLRTLR